MKKLVGVCGLLAAMAASAVVETEKDIAYVEMFVKGRIPPTLNAK